jgi:hypothetical protein
MAKIAPSLSCGGGFDNGGSQFFMALTGWSQQLLRLFPNNSAEELLVLAKIAPYLGS